MPLRAFSFPLALPMGPSDHLKVGLMVGDMLNQPSGFWGGLNLESCGPTMAEAAEPALRPCTHRVTPQSLGSPQSNPRLGNAFQIHSHYD